MPEKGAILPPVPSQLVLLRPSPLLQWRLGALTALVFFLMLVVWSIDGCSIQSFVEPWRFNAYSVRISPSPSPLMSPIPNLESEKPLLQNLTFNTTMVVPRNLDPNKTNLTSNSTRVQFGWITAELKKNFTANLLRNWLAPGGAPCREAKTVEISVPGVDGNDSVELTAGEIYEFKFQAMDESGKPVCIGGDYFEIDLSGESWKSRPPVKDFGNGTYSFSLQVHPEFAGDYNLTVILLFRHYIGQLLKAPLMLQTFYYKMELELKLLMSMGTGQTWTLTCFQEETRLVKKTNKLPLFHHHRLMKAAGRRRSRWWTSVESLRTTNPLSSPSQAATASITNTNFKFI